MVDTVAGILTAESETSAQNSSSSSLTRHEPLYLKHRPQALHELVGQTAVKQTLTNAINHDRLSHAYLFTGPRGTGKTSSARILAKSLNCKGVDESGNPIEKPTVTPCQKCASCLEIKIGNSPAVIEIDAASNNSVDDARLLIERAPLMAPGGRYKIYIIDECHMLTKEAFNALLKTIEEPPPNVVFILATTEEHKVLPTIISRSQRLMFRLVTQDDLLLHLRSVATQENIEISDRALEFIARRSGGGLRDALSLLDQSSLLAAPGKPVDVADLLTLIGALHEDVLLEMSTHVLHRRGHELLLCANKLLQEGREPAMVVQELARHFLNLSKASYLADSEDPQGAAGRLIVATPSYLQGLFEQAPHFDRAELSQLVELLDKLEQTCRRTSQPAMHLEVGLLAVCHRHEMLLIREIADRVSRLEQGKGISHSPAAGAPASGGARHTSTAQASSRPADSPTHRTAVGAPSQSAGSSKPPAGAPRPSLDSPAAEERMDRLPIDDIDDEVLDVSDALGDADEEEQGDSSSEAAPSAGNIAAPNAGNIAATVFEEDPSQPEETAAARASMSDSAATVAALASAVQPKTQTPPRPAATSIGSSSAPPIGPATSGESSARPIGPATATGSSAPPIGPATSAGSSAPPIGPATSAGSSAPPAATRAEAQPAPQTIVDEPIAAADHSGESDASPDEVDRVWSQTLDELQRRHLPTFSLVSMHAFPVSLNAKELSLGVATENFQKMIESKSEHVKNACTNVVGRPIGIKIRVVAKEFSPKVEQKPRERATSSPPSPRPEQPSDDEPGEPALQPRVDINKIAPASANRIAPEANAPDRNATDRTASDRLSTDKISADAIPGSTIAADRTATDLTPTAETSDADQKQPPPEPREIKPVSASELLTETASSNTGAIIKEAYRLFEGPGSRRIGD